MSPHEARLNPQTGNSRPNRRGTRLVGLALVAAVAVYLAAGIYFVQPDERGVVRILGRIPEGQRRVEPGLHYALPWPISRVDAPKTTEVRRAYVGLLPGTRDAINRGDVDAITASPDSDALTGDNNILKVTLVVQYQVSDPAEYLLGAAEPDELVRTAVQAVLIERLAELPVDRALTTAKAQLQNETLANAQKLLDRYRCGVRLVAANLEAIDPPQAVADAFKDVVSARKDAERDVDKAVAEANTILPRARGEAERLREEAEGYRLSEVGQARGDADRFLSLLAEYRKAEQVTRDRLRLEAFERVLPEARVFVVDNPEGDTPAHIKLIENTGGARPATP